MSDQEIEEPPFDGVVLYLPYLMLGWSIYPKEWTGEEGYSLLKPLSKSSESRRALDIKEHLIGLIKRGELSLYCRINCKWLKYEEIEPPLILRRMNVKSSTILDENGHAISCIVSETELVDRLQDYLRRLVTRRRGPKRDYLKFDYEILTYFNTTGKVDAERDEVTNYLNKSQLKESEIPGITSYNERIEQMRKITKNLRKVASKEAEEDEYMKRLLQHIKSVLARRIKNSGEIETN